MCDKAVIIFLLFLISALAIWVVYLLYRVQDLKEDVRVTKTMLDYYKDRLIKSEAKIHWVREELKDAC